jgi:hypothetical protein
MTALSRPDPDVRVPRGAKKAAARAEEIHAQLYPKEVPAEPVKEGADGGEAPKQEAAASAPAPEATPPAEPAPATPAAAEPGPGAEPAVTQPSKPSEQDWEHKFNSMKGRALRFEEANKQLLSRIADLESELANAKAVKPTQNTRETTESLITDDEVKDYGEEFLGVVGKKAKEILNPEVAELRRQVATLTEKLEEVGGSVIQNAREKMFNALDAGCQRWQQINGDPAFIAWLQLPDTYSGAIRHTLLKAAFERNDAPRVLAFFNGFLAEEAAVDPAPVAATPVPAAPAPARVSLEELAAPGRAKSPAATPAPAEKPIITRDQIASFYTAVNAGKYRGKDAEKAAYEKMIFEAQAAGRIR